MGSWKDKKTGELGSYFEAGVGKRIGELGSYFEAGVGKRISDTRVEVVAGWWQACGTYAVVLQNGSWSVESYKAWDMCW